MPTIFVVFQSNISSAVFCLL